MSNIKHKIIKENQEDSCWRQIWEAKGKEDSKDLRILDGFEGHDSINHETIAKDILRDIGHRVGDSILEVGCGAGCLAQFLPQPYHGIDSSSSLIDKFKTLLPSHSVSIGEAAALPCGDQSHDFVVLFSVSQYFTDVFYFKSAVLEFVRVARKGVLICDVRTKERIPFKDKYKLKAQHLLIPPESLTELIPTTQFQVSPAYYVHYGTPYNLLIGTTRPMCIYTDMCGDLFHFGHVRFLKNCKALFPNTRLIVGVHNDVTIQNYKRTPVCTHEERVEVVRSCRHVDEVYENAPLIVTPLLLAQLGVDIVVHANGINDELKQTMYGEVIKLGMYREVSRIVGISTTTIISRICKRKSSVV